ncbi:MAG: M3 family oligoendopeptidase [Thaumarchaeota archaeon]|nr:M3 family oligoendopeptidase [Nitrososphaerota archaeon]
MVFDYEKLPDSRPRAYVPAAIKFEWDALSAVFGELKSRNVKSPADLQKWLADEDELEAYLSEQRAIRYINSTRQTDNPAFTEAYQWYVREMEPRVKLASFDLLKAYLASPHRRALPPPTYGLEDRRRQTALKVFRVENVELEKQDSELAQKYQKVRAAMTVTFRGQERTLQQMAKFLEDTDRGLREEAWRLSESRYLKDTAELDGLYSQMVAIRDRAAHNAGFGNYEDYAFEKKDRFDYTPKDCAEFHSAVEEFIVPLSREIDRARRDRLGVEELKPWDMAVDPEGRPPLDPFEEVSGLVSGAAKVVAQVDGQLSGYFAKMVELEVLDLGSRKGKAPGGYQSELSEKGLPFIFMNAAGRDKDVRTLLHEAGHSFHTFLMHDRGLPFFNANSNLSYEFAEVASTSMEIISGEHYRGVFYDEAQAKRSNFEEAVGNVKLFTWVATIDAFQQWVYSHPGHTTEERREAWLDTFGRFCGLESYEGFEESEAYRWQRQLHLYEVPFYYIEYAIALTGALGIWSRYRRDRRDAIGAYKAALSLGATKSLPELFAAAGLEWGFGRGAMRRLSAELRSAIRELET